ncbi:hypothetical protein H7H37_19310, partial [Mycolicibacterium insubricum]|nr:hypothetical protein [Mycolicibacterium insubricum]
FYAASEGNAAFINVFNVDKSTGFSWFPLAYVEYDIETGDPIRAPTAGYAGSPPASRAC